MHDTFRVHPIKVALDRQWPRMSQAKLARQLDMNESLLSHYLSGRREPPEGFYLAVAAILKCDPEDLKPQEAAA